MKITQKGLPAPRLNERAKHKSDPRCSCFVLRRLSRTVSRLYDQHLAEVGLKTTQFSLLNTLSLGSATISELAFLLGLERTSLSRNLRPLISSRLIEIAPGSDAREKALRLSPEGRAMLRSGRRAWQLAQRQLVEVLGTKLVSELHSAVASAQRRVDELIR